MTNNANTTAGTATKKRTKLNFKIDSSIVDTSTRGIGGTKLGFIQQFCENSEDAQATKIQISLSPTEFVLLDDGEGMSPRGRDCFGGLGDSESRGKANKKGRNGTGAKAVRAVANRVSVETIWKDGLETLWSFSYTREEQKRALDGKLELFSEEGPRPDVFPLATGQSGTVIKVTEFDEGRAPDLDYVLEHLTDELDPRVAAKVTVNGQPLPKRQITGDIITSEPKIVEGLGRVYFNLYIPLKPAKGDRLRIGAKGPVCDLREFFENLPKALRARVPDVLLYPLLFGIIDVEAFADYPENSRRAFGIGLFTEPKGIRLLNVFLDWLTFDLAEEIEKRIGQLTKDDDKETTNRVLTEIQDLCAVVWGKSKKDDDKPPVPFTVSPRRVTMEPGETQTFKVKEIGDTSGKFKWDDSQAGGTLDLKDAAEVNYTAGPSPGQFKMSVQDTENDKLRCEVSLNIVQAREFRVSPSSVTLEVGENVTIRAKNVEHTSGELLWLASGSGGKLSTTEGHTAIYTAETQPGEYQVEVCDKQNAAIKSACKVTIVAKRENKDSGGTGIPVKIRDQFYDVWMKRFPNSPVGSFLVAGKSRHSIHINELHPAAVKCKKESLASFRNYVFTQLILRHVAKTGPDSNPDEVANAVSELQAELYRKK